MKVINNYFNVRSFNELILQTAFKDFTGDQGGYCSPGEFLNLTLHQSSLGVINH